MNNRSFTKKSLFINGWVSLFLLLLATLNARAQSTGQNYTQTLIPTMNNLTTNALLSTAATDRTKVRTTITYIDGLGRPAQTVQKQASPAGFDIVIPSYYDQYGREARTYLPYTATTSDGSYKTDAFTAVAGEAKFYNPAGNGVSGTQQSNGIPVIPTPYAQSVYESSPLNRPTERGAPGDPWQPVAGSTAGHTVRIRYATNNITALTDTANSTTAALYKVIINSDESRTLVRGSGVLGFYPVNQLYVTVSRNENLPGTGRGGTVEEYKDKQGRIVLKRTFNYLPGPPISLQILSTYYVYDDVGNLAFVLTPASGADNATPSQTILDNLCYQYQYDQRNRLVQKKLPCKGWQYIVYNALDQVVATQDANQKTSNQWTFTKYDAMGRVFWNGTWNNGGTATTRPGLQATIDGLTSPLWETRPAGGSPTNVAWPTSGFQNSLMISYYDDYGFPGLPYAIPSSASKMTKGLLTGTITYVLGSSATLYTVYCYDDLGRNTEVIKEHYLGGTTGAANASNYDDIVNTYDFSNELSSSIRHHYTTTGSVTVGTAYYYDPMGRKKQTWEAITTGGNTASPSVLLNQEDYNELGQLMTKHLYSETGSAPFLQDINYAYNERGWLRTSGGTGALFREDIRYNTADAGITQQYNGNISEDLYSKTGVGTITDKYGYDQLNRLTSSVSSDNLGETISYDLMGNITNLTRLGPSAATLSYSYLNGINQSNQLVTVMNGSAIYRSYVTYDPNGNALSDGTPTTPKNITYNLFNLPGSITQNGTALASYTYDGSGNKIANMGNSNKDYWNYISGIVYNGTTATNGTIRFIQTEDGQAVPNGSTWHYEYNLMDHLGNVRLSFDKNPTGGTARRIQEDEYYPFGLRSAVYTDGENNRYLYNGKEVQNDLANQYDYGARFYDPAIARWTSIDPHGEKYESITPYNYGLDNPIKHIDIEGSDPGDIVVAFSGATFSNGTTVSTDLLTKYLANNSNGATVIYDSSTFVAKTYDEATQEAFDAIIANYKSDPNGKVILYGYSYGGVLANYLAKRLDAQKIKVTVLVTVDAADGWLSGSVDRTISNNVELNENYFEDNVHIGDPTFSHGAPNSGKNGQVVNHDESNNKSGDDTMTHMNIPNATLKKVETGLMNILNGLANGGSKTLTQSEILKLYDQPEKKKKKEEDQ